jgi:hypothetical protein
MVDFLEARKTFGGTRRIAVIIVILEALFGNTGKDWRAG